MKPASFSTIIFLPLLVVACVRADDKPTLQTITDAWRNREKAIQSYDFHWWSKCFTAAETEAPKFVQQAGLPKRPDSNFIWQYRFASDGNGHSRYEGKGRTWIMTKGDFFPTSSIGIYENNVSKTIFLAPNGDHDYPMAIVNLTHSSTSIAEVPPINLAFRPLSIAAGGLDEQTLELTSETATIDNDPVVVVHDGHRKVWVDPSKDYLPVKCSEAGPLMSLEFSISYLHDPIGWVPHSWTIDEGGGEVKESATVTEFAVNKPIAATEFTINFPDGAIINDATKHTLWISYPDGRQRSIKSSELTGRNFQDLLKSEADTN